MRKRTKLINCACCGEEFEVKYKNKKLKYCESCRKPLQKYRNYANQYRAIKQQINDKLIHFKVLHTGDIGNRIKFEKYLNLDHGIKNIQKKEIYLQFIEELEQQLQEEKENIQKW